VKNLEQNKINVILIAGIIVAGAGAWAGPIMIAQTANEFFDDLDEIQTAQVGFYEGQGFNFDEFGLGDLKDEIFFFDHFEEFELDFAFGGPIVDMISFNQQLVPADVTGINLPTITPNDFGAPVTIIEMQGCGIADAVIGGSTSLLFDECQPAIVDKIFIMTNPNNVDANAKFRVQVAICEDFNMAGHVADVGNTDPTNDTCDADPNTNTGDPFEDGLIILDLVVQPYTDHTETIIIEGGAIPSFLGSTLMARAADSTANTNNVNIWVGVKRVGDLGAFEFINPAQFGGNFVDGCVFFDINNNVATIGAGTGIFMEVFGIPFFAVTDVNGQVQFNNVPLDTFAIIDVELANSVQFIDQPLLFGVTNNEGLGSGCFEITHDIVLDAPQF